jgi:L-histidine N-alpha-methyltransferase
METEFARRQFASDVRAGLTRHGQKELHSKYFYDDLGSTLFDAITLLPEYGLTRADVRLLETHAPAVAAALCPPVHVIELGSGSGRKTRSMLQAFAARQSSTNYSPIDVSAAALARCGQEVGQLACVHPIHAAYLDGLPTAVNGRANGERLLVLFLGSNIGNFEPRCAAEFLAELRQCLEPGDALLLGADLVKPRAQLLLAYDDPTGITAAFNLNLLARVNRELGADFDVRSFEHQAIYNETHQRIEMHLRSRWAQTVRIRDADCTIHFRAGETIWTESSHKFDLPGLARMARDSGFRVQHAWVDEEWPFAEILWMAV